MITIDIVSDTVCPWCFIGKRRLETALARKTADIQVGIAWRPFQLNPDMPKGGLDRRKYLEAKFGGPEGARQVYDAIEEAGHGEGIAFDFGRIAHTPNTVDSHRLIDRAGRSGRQDAAVEALFRAYFLEGRDIGNLDVLTEVAALVGLDAAESRAYLESDEDVERIQGEDAMARKMGIQGVPCFILNRKYAISGAQEPEVFLQAFTAIEDEVKAAGAPTAL